MYNPTLPPFSYPVTYTLSLSLVCFVSLSHPLLATSLLFSLGCFSLFPIVFFHYIIIMFSLSFYSGLYSFLTLHYFFSCLPSSLYCFFCPFLLRFLLYCVSYLSCLVIYFYFYPILFLTSSSLIIFLALPFS